MIHVEEINDVLELGGYRLVFGSLLPQTRRATFFQSLDWLEVFCQHHPDARLRALVVFSSGRAVGILPLVVLSQATPLGTMRVLTYPLPPGGVWYGPVGPNPTATLTAALRHVYQTQRDWDIVDLRGVDADGHDHGRTAAAMHRLGWTFRKTAWRRAPTVDTSTSWSSYWHGRPAEWKSRIAQALDGLQRHGCLDLRRERPEGVARGDIETPTARLSAEHEWIGAGSLGFFADAELSAATDVEAYRNNLDEALARHGCLDISTLTLDDRPIAVAYGTHYQDHVRGLWTAMDPALADWPLAEVLIARLIEDSFGRSDCQYEFALDAAAIGEQATEFEASYAYRHVPRVAARGQLWRMGCWLSERWHRRHHASPAQPA